MITTKPGSVYGDVHFINVCTHPPTRERNLQSKRNEGNKTEERKRWSQVCGCLSVLNWWAAASLLSKQLFGISSFHLLWEKISEEKNGWSGMRENE